GATYAAHPHRLVEIGAHRLERARVALHDGPDAAGRAPDVRHPFGPDERRNRMLVEPDVFGRRLPEDSRARFALPRVDRFGGAVQFHVPGTVRYQFRETVQIRAHFAALTIASAM